MSVTWVKLVAGVEGAPDTWVDDGETHVGLVMGLPYTREQRVMSDVWARVTLVNVWNPETEKPEPLALHYGFELNSRTGTSTIDIDPKIQAAWDLKQAEAAEAARIAAERFGEEEAERLAEADLKKISKGIRVVVVRGRKVPKGTQGVVIWEGPGDWGPRVGIKDGQGPPHWLDTSYVEAVVPGVLPGETPEGGWRALREKIRAEENEWKSTFPKKDDWVRILESGIEGKVFWAQDERIGLNRRGAESSEDAIWVNVWEVEILDKDGNVVGQASRENPRRGAAHPLEHMAHPLCDIRTVSKDPDGDWAAFSDAGTLILKLSPEGASQLQKLLGQT